MSELLPISFFFTKFGFRFVMILYFMLGVIFLYVFMDLIEILNVI